MIYMFHYFVNLNPQARHFGIEYKLKIFIWNDHNYDAHTAMLCRKIKNEKLQYVICIKLELLDSYKVSSKLSFGYV